MGSGEKDQGGAGREREVEALKPNVIIALTDIEGGEAVILPDESEITALTRIPFSHKVALKDFSMKEDIIKYGEIIGQAGEDIKKGEWVHTHNLLVQD
jgi:altronate dehydratase